MRGGCRLKACTLVSASFRRATLLNRERLQLVGTASHHPRQQQVPILDDVGAHGRALCNNPVVKRTRRTLRTSHRPGSELKFTRSGRSPSGPARGTIISAKSLAASRTTNPSTAVRCRADESSRRFVRDAALHDWRRAAFDRRGALSWDRHSEA